MTESEPYTSGQVLTTESPSKFVSILTEKFSETRVRESSHYTTGEYVKMNLDSDIEFFFEHIDGSEYLVAGEGDDLRLLEETAAELAKLFASKKFKCRFETYDGDDQLTSYSHYAWPPLRKPSVD